VLILVNIENTHAPCVGEGGGVNFANIFWNHHLSSL